MSRAAHTQYREQLAALAGDIAVLRAIQNATPAHAWWSPDKTWRRMAEAFHPGQEPYAALTYEAVGPRPQLFHVEVFQEQPADYGDGLVAPEQILGWVRYRPFPADSILNTLSQALAGGGQPRVLQYWPGKRCTIRFEEGTESRYTKVYPKKFLRRDRGAQLHRVATALSTAAGRGEIGFTVAAPVCWDADTRTLWQLHLEGTPASSLLAGDSGCRVAYRMGQAAASLGRCGIVPTRIFDVHEQLADSADYGGELATHVPRLAATVDALLSELEAMAAEPLQRALCPVHGDLHAGQWVVDGPRLGLLDFDDFSLGEPERDAAFFVTQLESELGLGLRVAQLAEAFLAGFEEVAGSLDPRRVAAYAAHKWLSKARKAARELRSDGDARAERMLSRAIERAHWARETSSLVAGGVQ